MRHPGSRAIPVVRCRVQVAKKVDCLFQRATFFAYRLLRATAIIGCAEMAAVDDRSFLLPFSFQVDPAARRLSTPYSRLHGRSGGGEVEGWSGVPLGG